MPATAHARVEPIAVETPAAPVHEVRAEGIELVEPEPKWKRRVYGAIALALSIGFFITLIAYWVPAQGGTDQNGYLVGGRMFAENLTMRQSPVRPGSSEFDPHQHIGRMWVGADEGKPDERYYPKYPIGLPALYACALWIGAAIPSVPPSNWIGGGDGISWGQWLAYGISPVSMSLAIFATYLLARRFAGSFGGLLTAIVFASSPVTLELADNPNSHASCVCCVTWGMYLLICWWQNKGMLKALAAGFLLGYAATIRYTEGTLIAPITLVALYGVQWKSWRSPQWRHLAQALAMIGAWAVPVGLLVLYNHFAIGATTGYDPTNESTGFRWSFAAVNWETMIRQLNTTGLSLLFPLALAGLVWMFWWSWREASVLAAWIVPCILIYTFYYWAPDGTSIGYLRFFETILPALTLCFFWLMSRLNLFALRHSRMQVAGPRTAVRSNLIVAMAGVIGLIVVGAALEHAWLWEYDPAVVGWKSSNRIVHLLTPAMKPQDVADLDEGSVKEAWVDLESVAWGALSAGAMTALIATAVVRGRLAVPAVGAGVLTGVVVAMHLVNALPWLENDQLTRYQLDFKARAIRESVPEGSVVFCQDGALIDHFQFLGDYALYDAESFSRWWVQNLPHAEPPDQPQGLDPGRRDALFQRLKDLDQKGLDDQARTIMSDALAANRRVFFIVQGRPNDVLPRKVRKAMGLPAPKVLRGSDLVTRWCTPDRFDTDVAAFWPGYSPRAMMPVANTPRANRAVRSPELQILKQPLQILEVTRHVALVPSIPARK